MRRNWELQLYSSMRTILFLILILMFLVIAPVAAQQTPRPQQSPKSEEARTWSYMLSSKFLMMEWRDATKRVVSSSSTAKTTAQRLPIATQQFEALVQVAERFRGRLNALTPPPAAREYHIATRDLFTISIRAYRDEAKTARVGDVATLSRALKSMGDVQRSGYMRMLLAAQKQPFMAANPTWKAKIDAQLRDEQAKATDKSPAARAYSKAFQKLLIEWRTATLLLENRPMPSRAAPQAKRFAHIASHFGDLALLNERFYTRAQRLPPATAALRPLQKAVQDFFAGNATRFRNVVSSTKTLGKGRVTAALSAANKGEIDGVDEVARNAARLPNLTTYEVRQLLNWVRLLKKEKP